MQNVSILHLFLVRMTGFEPTRLSTLEPETSASAVPPHPHYAFLLYHDLYKSQVHFLKKDATHFDSSLFTALVILIMAK